MGLLSSVGSFVNDVYGVTSSSKQAYNQSKNLANMSYGQQKEFAQNAHQWEMEDLQKAGLNPALTTGASSAGTIAGGGSTGGQGVTGTPVDILSSMGNIASDISNAINTTKLTNADVNLKKAQARLTKEQTKYQNADINFKNAQTKLTKEQTKYQGYFPEEIMTGTSWFGTGGTKASRKYVKRHSAK